MSFWPVSRSHERTTFFISLVANDFALYRFYDPFGFALTRYNGLLASTAHNSADPSIEHIPPLLPIVLQHHLPNSLQRRKMKEIRQSVRVLLTLPHRKQRIPPSRPQSHPTGKITLTTTYPSSATYPTRTLASISTLSSMTS